MNQGTRIRLLALIGVPFLLLMFSCQQNESTILEGAADTVQISQAAQTINWYYRLTFYQLIASLKKERREYSYAPIEDAGKRYGAVQYDKVRDDVRVRNVYVVFRAKSMGAREELGDFNCMLMEIVFSEEDREKQKAAITVALGTEPRTSTSENERATIWTDTTTEKEVMLLQGEDYDIICLARRNAKAKKEWFERVIKHANFVTK